MKTRDIERDALRLAGKAARRAGLRPEGLSVLRHATSVLVDIEGCGAIARFEPPDQIDLAHRQTMAARFLAERDLPAARLVAPSLQPFVDHEGAVTLWHRLLTLDGTPSPAELGRLARRLHRATAGERPPNALPVDPFSQTWPWLERAARIAPEAGIDPLRAELIEIEGRWPELSRGDPLGTAFLHGDLHVENVLLTAAGPKLVDLEAAGWGPVTWDLAPQWVAVRRFGASRTEYRAFCQAYGADGSLWEGAMPMSRLVEILLACWAVAHGPVSSRLAEEGALRLATLRGESDRAWTLF